ncbi:unnamed protein product [Paramecium sonneborni]|uniref:Protein kinase domain-containing protein n=1 Tax=Paramecium sonneborni TaxID=65129 RepID=A0A8S1PFU7_9CILI|nr:unnamed protein product [Paramecium sonneborni]
MNTQVYDLFISNENPKFVAKLLAQYRIIQFLGQGAFSSVFKVFHDGEFYAIKIVEKMKGNTEKLQQEALILNQLKHPNIVRYHKTFESKRRLYFILSFIDGKTLQQYIDDGNIRFYEKECIAIIRQLVDVLSYLHSNRIIHRDIKPDNMIVDKNLNLTLIDFGLSYMTTQQITTHQNCGTLIYMAPEVLMKKEYFKSVDIWSCGIIQYQLLKNCHPFWTNQKKEKYIKQMSVPQKVDFSGMSKYNFKFERAAISFFEKTAAFEPEARITAEQALLHPWITCQSSETYIMTSKEIFQAYKGIAIFTKFQKLIVFLQFVKQNSEKAIRAIVLPSTQRFFSKQKSPKKPKILKIPTRSCLNSSHSSRDSSEKQKIKLPPIINSKKSPKGEGSPNHFLSNNKIINPMQTAIEFKKSHFRLK